jgi:hypothetical protein
VNFSNYVNIDLSAIHLLSIEVFMIASNNISKVTDSDASTGIKQTTRGMRRLLLAASLLVVSVGVSLYLFSGQTELLFSWTISVPLTAAFLGAGYWASFLLELLSSREHIWAKARVAVPAVLIFTSLTLLVTLLHLDRFHFGATEIITRIGTWVWLGVYVSVPILMSILLFQQLRTPGIDPVRVAPLPAWTRFVLWAQSLIMVILGIALFAAPQTFIPLWAWELTPLTGRAVGAWLVGLGIAAAHAAYENDWTRLFPMMVSYASYGVLNLIALARYPDAAGLDWSATKTWVFVIFIVSILLVGIYGTIQARAARRRYPDAI